MLKIYGNKASGFSASYEQTTEDLEKLTFCPFCGMSHDLEISNTHTACYTVDCNNCGASMNGGLSKGYNGGKILTMGRCAGLHALALLQVIERWNTRD